MDRTKAIKKEVNLLFIKPEKGQSDNEDNMKMAFQVSYRNVVL